MMSFRYAFTNVWPFRRILLGLLSPYDIAKVLQCLDCKLTRTEWNTHMDIINDIFLERSHIDSLLRFGLRIYLFGFDLQILSERLKDPLHYDQQYGKNYILYVFAIVSTPTSNQMLSIHQPQLPCFPPVSVNSSWRRLKGTHSTIQVYVHNHTSQHDIPWVNVDKSLIGYVFGCQPRNLFKSVLVRPLRHPLSSIIVDRESRTHKTIYGQRHTSESAQSMLAGQSMNPCIVLAPTFSDPFVILCFT
jgi:hypothetical protein